MLKKRPKEDLSGQGSCNVCSYSVFRKQYCKRNAPKGTELSRTQLCFLDDSGLEIASLNVESSKYRWSWTQGIESLATGPTLSRLLGKTVRQ